MSWQPWVKVQTSSLYGKLATRNERSAEYLRIKAHNNALHATSASIAASARRMETLMERARWGLSTR